MSRTGSHRTWVRAALLGLGAAAVAGGVYVLATVPPGADSFYPGCTLYAATGFHCAGCGGTRAAHALLNGRVAQSVAYHPFLIPLSLAAVWLTIRSYLRQSSHPARESRWAAAWPWLVLAALLAFTVVRNLPWYPLTLLAPHEL
jgi:hypothetical protein